MKRLINLLLVFAVTVANTGMYSAFAEGDSGYKYGDISIFDSFSDYSGVYGNGCTLPNGFINIDNGRAKNVGAEKYVDEIRTSNVVKMGPDSEPVLPFGTNFLDGYMHVSFDFRQQSSKQGENTGRNLRVMFARNETKDNATDVYADLNGNLYNTDSATAQEWNMNEYDYTKLVKGKTTDLFTAGSKESGIARKLSNGNQRLVGITDINGTLDDENSTEADTWYKTDMFFDRETNMYYVYINGVLQDYGFGLTNGEFVETDKKSSIDFTAEGRRAIKGLVFRCDQLRENNSENKIGGSEDGTIYLDNVYVNGYTANNCTNDVLKITADDFDEIIRNGSKLNIGFSEYLTAVPSKENITITKNGVAFDGFTVTSDKSQATLTFNRELESGVYSLAISGVKGAISGSDVSNTIEFVASDSGENADAANYYWANENFNGFEEGVVPPNWYYGSLDRNIKDQYNRYYMPEAKANYSSNVKKTTGADGTAAIELSENSGTESNNMYYFFPRGVASGEFKTEFDIKHKNGGWTFGFVNYDDYNASYNRDIYGRLTTGGSETAGPVVDGKGNGWITSMKSETSILIGMAVNGNTKNRDGAADSVEKRAFSPNVGMIGQDSTVTNQNRLGDPNNLSKTDLTIAPDTWSKVEIDVNDNSKSYNIKVTPYKADGTLDTENAQTTVWNDIDNNRYFKGIMGLRFSRNAHSESDLTTYEAEQTGSVCIDNVKVYRTATAYLNENFDNYTESETGTSDKKLPSGWTMWNSDLWRANYYVGATKTTKNVTGANGRYYNTESNPNDKSMFMYYGTSIIYKTLDRPVPAGEPFVMEFDMYNVNTTDKTDRNNRWSVLQMGKDDTMQLPGYNFGDGVSATGKVYVAPATDSATGTSVPGNLVNDNILGGYLPFASYTDTEGQTVTPTLNDTYARISGNFMRMNTVLGTGSDNNHTILHYSSTGRYDALRSFGWNYNQISDISDVTNDWEHFKLVCKPISETETQYTLTQTKSDGTETSASFKNSRDWVTYDTYAIGFGVPFKNGDINKTDGTFGVKIDNVKVYAANTAGNAETKVLKNHISSIVAENADGERCDIINADNIPEGTTSVEIKFPMPINEKISPTLPEKDGNTPETQIPASNGTFTSFIGTSDDYFDYTSILDSIKDVISLRKIGTQTETDYEISLSEDKKTVTLTFENALTESEKYTLGINQNIAFGGGGYARLGENFVKTYAVSGEFESELINFTKVDVTVRRGTADIPVNKAGALSAGEKVKVMLTSENMTSEDAQVFIGYAFYDKDKTNDSRVLTQISDNIVTVPKNTKKSVSKLNEITVPESHTLFKVFTWSYPGMQPYADVIENNQ